MNQEHPPMELTGVDDNVEPQMFAQPLPGDPGSRGRRVGEESEVPAPALALAPATGRRTLDEPREPSLPFGVDPVAGIAGSEDLLDSADVNREGSRAYHGSELPDIGPIDPGNLSCQPKFRSFQVQPPKGSPRHQ